MFWKILNEFNDTVFLWTSFKVCLSSPLNFFLGSSNLLYLFVFYKKLMSELKNVHWTSQKLIVTDACFISVINIFLCYVFLYFFPFLSLRRKILKNQDRVSANITSAWQVYYLAFIILFSNMSNFPLFIPEKLVPCWNWSGCEIWISSDSGSFCLAMLHVAIVFSLELLPRARNRRIIISATEVRSFSLRRSGTHWKDSVKTWSRI